MSERKIILIIEDQADIRKLIKMTMELGNSEVHEADNGENGWHMVKALRPHLVLLDVMMPGSLDGYQVCQKIKQDPVLRQTAVVLLTARGQQADFDMGHQAGADAYLTKPFSPLELIDTVDGLLDKSNRQPV
ncbi:response regulator [Dechloromonas sp. TW-R-39-2]|uniref:response regulator transcription factor n=1 Tax=Dechloromonas sp. TW-R-39-2 TaxID=2654218 RepID=UPI00193CD373|nr:response regulator [Dechloromonas sp. TW-R-39-2]QRM20726.1 response regulator [Dechloromonas sp. TW-R-39-2]